MSCRNPPRKKTYRNIKIGLKRVVLNRKNSLFVGNPRGGRTAAILASLTSTCRRHDVDPQLYLTQLLINLPAAPMSELSAWLPDQRECLLGKLTSNLWFV